VKIKACGGMVRVDLQGCAEDEIFFIQVYCPYATV
jgi:hypothetical protein